MTAYEQSWVDAIVDTASTTSGTEHEPCRVQWVVTDTENGKVAFHLELDKGRPVSGVAAKLPRGQSADVTITAKEAVFKEVWAGDLSRDVAFMSGALKIEGAYHRWLDELVPCFALSPWSEAWAEAVR